MGTYSTNADVAKRIPGRTLSASSKPSTTDVDQWILEFEAEVEGLLAAAGMSVPVGAARGVLVLKRKVTSAAAAEWKKDVSGVTDIEDEKSAQDDWQEWRDFLLKIQTDPGGVAAMLGQGSGASGGPSQLRSYPTDNVDGKTIEDGDFNPRFELDEDL